MRGPIEEWAGDASPEWLAGQLAGQPGLVLLRTGMFDGPHTRCSFIAARPFLMFRSKGSRCEVTPAGGRGSRVHHGNPWQVLGDLMRHYELPGELDVPFPLGGCFGYWGYDLKNFVEPRLPRRAADDLQLPDCCVGFYDSLLAFDHHLGKAWIIATGLGPDGERTSGRVDSAIDFWRALGERGGTHGRSGFPAPGRVSDPCGSAVVATLSRGEFVSRVRRAQEYIRQGDIYQVNLALRLDSRAALDGWELYQRLAAVSPAPFSAYMDCGPLQVASSSPELFLRMSGREIRTRPIKGTRPRSADPTRDTQLACELQASAKERAELGMITDLLRNDLGKVSEFGRVTVPDLARLERFAQVQHLVSTVEGRLRPDLTHLDALASSFPGGSVTGAPKIRAMEVIDELEPVARGPYTGALGYLGFNGESQLSMVIRTAIRSGGRIHFHAGSGIVADSSPEAEYEETLAKAAGFLSCIGHTGRDSAAGLRANLYDCLPQ